MNDLIVAARSKNGTPLYEGTCPDCGIVRLQDKRRLGKPCMSCSNKRRSTHGLSNDPLYRLLKNAYARCTYPSASNYEYYGARGIRVYEGWLSNPASFVEWAMANGYEPGLELDRIEVDKGYEPGNCRFISHQRNSQLRRNARCTREQAAQIKALLSSGNNVRSVSEEMGVPYMTVWHIKKGNTWTDC